MMTIISRIGIALTFIAAALPIVVSRTVGANDCSEQEFWYTPNACCLPKGGPPSPPPPPKGTECPYTHYWGTNQGCCVPSNPPPEGGPPPQCPNHWDWSSSLRKCTPTPTQPSPPPSSPSGSYGHGDGGNGHGHEEDGHNHKRSLYKRTLHNKARSARLCPIGFDACPIGDGDYECLDTATELESCGGCTSLGSGQDCTAILGAWNIGCEQGSCAVYTCAGGFERAPDGKSCVPLK